MNKDALRELYQQMTRRPTKEHMSSYGMDTDALIWGREVHEELRAAATATEIVERERQVEKQIRLGSAYGMGAKALCEMYGHDLAAVDVLESIRRELMRACLAPSIMGNPHAHSTNTPVTSVPDWFRRDVEVHRAAVDDDEPFDDIDAPPEMVDVHYVLCKKCGASALKESFYFNGARINDCKCKPGREAWVTKTIKQEVGDRPKDVIPPAKR